MFPAFKITPDKDETHAGSIYMNTDKIYTLMLCCVKIPLKKLIAESYTHFKNNSTALFQVKDLTEYLVSVFIL